MDAGSEPPGLDGPSRWRRSRRLSPWGLTVACSFGVLALAAAAMGAMRLTMTSSSSSTVSIGAELTRVELNVERGNVTVLGGGNPSPVVLRHHDHSAFGHGPIQLRTVRDGVLSVSSSCPTVLLGSCSSDYQLIVPDNVPVTVRAGDGGITLDAYHGSAELETGGGPIRVVAFCGFELDAKTSAGDIDVGASCSPQELRLLSSSGDITAVVPPGRYQIEAASSSGVTHPLRGLTSERGAPWSIQAISNSGDVSVEAAP
ncbi:MAG: DUF4097 family beta strand repeat-containing protein [Gaiellaceae bacterium]